MTDTPDQPGSDLPRDPLWDRPAPSTAALGAPVRSAGVGPSVQWDPPADSGDHGTPDSPGGPSGPDGPDGPEAPGSSDGTPRHRRGRRKPRSSVRSAVEWAAVIVGALVVALVVKTFLFQAFYIPSASMEPTLRKGDRVLVNKLSYDLHDIHRGDIVVFELPPEKVGPDGIKDLIKRVIGLPGETIETREGIVYINDKKIEEPYLPDGVTTNKPPDPTPGGARRAHLRDGRQPRQLRRQPVRRTAGPSPSTRWWAAPSCRSGHPAASAGCSYPSRALTAATMRSTWSE